MERVLYSVRPINPEDHFTELKMPILLLHSQTDELSPTQSLYDLKNKLEAVNQKNVKFVFVPDSTHNLIDSDKSRGFYYSQMIADFINN